MNVMWHVSVAWRHWILHKCLAGIIQWHADSRYLCEDAMSAWRHVQYLSADILCIPSFTRLIHLPLTHSLSLPVILSFSLAYFLRFSIEGAFLYYLVIQIYTIDIRNVISEGNMKGTEYQNKYIPWNKRYNKLKYPLAWG